MHSHRFLVRLIINGIEYETIIVFIFRLPEDIILQHVGFYFVIILSVDYMLFSVQADFLLLPHFEIETADKHFGRYHTF